MLAALLAGLAGLLVGSFLNVCIYRLPRDLSVAYPARSFCPRCGRTLPASENIPVLSWVFLRGRCRGCGGGISWRYPAIELFTGLLAFLAALEGGWSGETLRLAVFAFLLVVLLLTDLETRILPDEATVGGAAIGWLIALLLPRDPGVVGLLIPDSALPAGRSLAGAVLAGVLPAAAFWLLGELYRWIRQREGLGLGDVKMLLMLGAFTGLESTLLTVMLASISGSVAGGILLLRQGRSAATYELPFGSFLAGAALLTEFGPILARI